MSEGVIEIPNGWYPRDYQYDAWDFLDKGGRRLDLPWHRRCGKDLFSLAALSKAAISVPGIYWHILPYYAQARDVIWNGRTNDGVPFLDVFGPEKGGIITRKHENEMSIELCNQSIFKLHGADQPDRLVGGNVRGCVLSEWSLMDPEVWTKIIQPMLEANKGFAIFIYTPRGKNHAYRQRQRIKGDPEWFSQILTINDTRDEQGNPIISPERVDKMRKEGTNEALIQQEYYCSFESPIEGAYYEKEMARVMTEKRICRVPWEPRLPVDTAWDLGMNDSTVVWFFQHVNSEIRVIDLYHNSGEGLAHYAKVLKERPYVYGTHYGPHDLAVRELGSADSRIDTARRLGVRFRLVNRQRVEDGIEAVRNILPRCWFDSDKCDRGIEALKGYHKTWNEKEECYSDRPVHDWTSDYADAFRTYAMGRRGTVEKRAPDRAKAEYDIFNCIK